VLLDRSAFYPESGGQMADRGDIDGNAVIDVQIDEGRILHFVDGAAPAVGDSVTGTIDGARRRVHMALHTGQHILSRALLDACGYDTVSSRLGETQCTIDLDVAQADEHALARAESLACSVVDDDVEVSALFPDAAELEAMSLRKRPPAASRIRVVRIGDFDVTPCGGTHCTRSAQVGLLRITGVERHKRRARLSFVAGGRARDELGEHDRLLRALARDLSCGPSQVADGIDKLRAELDAARKEAKAVGGVAAELLASALGAQEPPVIAALDGPPAVVRDVAKRLCTRSDMVCLLAAHRPDVTHVVCARGADADFDCGAFVKRVTAATGGRGGGRSERAEGKLPPGIDWPAAAREHLSAG
jgi:alanyl-tRNA synthetase